MIPTREWEDLYTFYFLMIPENEWQEQWTLLI
jgi:hypothetical protein